jgi:hypothetical protein
MASYVTFNIDLFCNRSCSIGNIHCCLLLMALKGKVSHPDLFHLSLWLSPPPSRCRPSSPLIPCVFIPVFSVCPLSVHLLCQVNQLVCVSAPAFPSLSFSHPLGFVPCLSWLSPPAWPLCLTLSLPANLYLCPTSGLLTSAYPEPAYRPVPLSNLCFTDPCLDLSIAFPCCIIKPLFIRRCLHLGLTFIPDRK